MLASLTKSLRSRFFPTMPRTPTFQMYEPDIGATSTSALIISGLSLNFSATATNHLSFGFALLKRSDSYWDISDIESGKPAAAASKSLTTSLQFCFLAPSRGLDPVLSFWLAARWKWDIFCSKSLCWWWLWLLIDEWRTAQRLYLIDVYTWFKF